MNNLKALAFNAALFYEHLTNKEATKANQILDRADQLDRNGILQMKEEAFQDIIKHTLEYSSYYKEIAQQRGLTASDFKSIADLNKLPYLTKDIIKSRRNDIIVNNIPESECIKRTSGGTTGEPIYIEVDKQCRTNDLYFYYRGLRWMGWQPGYQMVKFFGGSLSGQNAPTLRNKIKKYLSGEVFLPAFNFNKDTALQYLDTVKAQGETFVQGYVSSIYNLAVLTKELNYKGLKIKGAFTTAEQLPDEQAQFVKEVLGCDVKAFYGCAEINCLGFQTIMGGRYISPDEIIHIESTQHPDLPLDNAFLLTSLFNKKTPLLRYLNGDNGTLGSHGKYSTIEELSGRSADMFRRKDGSLISSIVATQTMQITGLTHKVKKYQLWQTAIDKVEIPYLPFLESEPLSAEERKHIEAMYKKRLGDEFEVTMYLSDQFVQSASGKHRLMINKLNS